MSWYRQQLEEWLKTLEVKADVVLDIGGAQGPVKDRVKSWDVRDYQIWDLPNYDLEVRWDMPQKHRVADIIFCLEVFEYIIDPRTAIKNISRVLKSGGKAYITFAFAYPTHNELEMDSLRYTEPGIKRLADSANLKINNIWYRTDKSGHLQAFYQLDGMHPAKEYAHHDVTGFIVEMEKL